MSLPRTVPSLLVTALLACSSIPSLAAAEPGAAPASPARTAADAAAAERNASPNRGPSPPLPQSENPGSVVELHVYPTRSCWVTYTGGSKTREVCQPRSNEASAFPSPQQPVTPSPTQSVAHPPKPPILVNRGVGRYRELGKAIVATT